jgi:hypothetical protein
MHLTLVSYLTTLVTRWRRLQTARAKQQGQTEGEAPISEETVTGLQKPAWRISRTWHGIEAQD